MTSETTQSIKGGRLKKIGVNKLERMTIVEQGNPVPQLCRAISAAGTPVVRLINGYRMGEFRTGAASSTPDLVMLNQSTKCRM